MKGIFWIIAGISGWSIAIGLVYEYIEDIRRTDFWETLFCLGGIGVVASLSCEAIRYGREICKFL